MHIAPWLLRSSIPDSCPRSTDFEGLACRCQGQGKWRIARLNLLPRVHPRNHPLRCYLDCCFANFDRRRRLSSLRIGHSCLLDYCQRLASETSLARHGSTVNCWTQFSKCHAPCANPNRCTSTLSSTIEIDCNFDTPASDILLHEVNSLRSGLRILSVGGFNQESKLETLCI